MYVCTCYVHINICIHLHIYIYIHLHVYIYIHINVLSFIYIIFMSSGNTFYNMGHMTCMGYMNHLYTLHS
jgi:hypothetical protein